MNNTRTKKIGESFIKCYLLLAGLWMLYFGLGVAWMLCLDPLKGSLTVPPDLLGIIPTIGNYLNAIANLICGYVCIRTLFRWHFGKKLIRVGIMSIVAYAYQILVSCIYIGGLVINSFTIYILVPIGVIICGVLWKRVNGGNTGED